MRWTAADWTAMQKATTSWTWMRYPEINAPSVGDMDTMRETVQAPKEKPKVEPSSGRRTEKISAQEKEESYVVIVARRATPKIVAGACTQN